MSPDQIRLRDVRLLPVYDMIIGAFALAFAALTGLLLAEVVSSSEPAWIQLGGLVVVAAFLLISLRDLQDRLEEASA